MNRRGVTDERLETIQHLSAKVLLPRYEVGPAQVPGLLRGLLTVVPVVEGR